MEYVGGRPVPRHIQLLCDKLHQCMERKIPRLLVCLPPGHMKSYTCSHHLPSYYLSQFPDHQVVAATHTESFSETWGRKVRNLMLGDEHRIIFPHAQISEDSRAASRWDLTTGGGYFATGVGGAVTGRRADLVIMDDLLRGIEDANSATIRENMWQWFGSDLSTRMKPGAIMIYITTRWHLDDLAGRLIQAEQNGGDKWEKLIFPAIALEKDQLGRKPGEALWPEEYSLKILENIKSNPAITGRQWESLYQQDPVGEDGGLIKRQWFKPWKRAEPPKCSIVLQSWDTAISQKDTAAYSACLTFGVFEEDESKLPAMILLSAFRARLLYPDLRKMAQRLAWNYMDDDLKRPKLKPAKKQPGMILVEDRSSGSSLIADLMRAGIQGVVKVNPSRHGSKDARLMLSSDVLENGRVYVPYMGPQFTQPYRWADEWISELCSFPAAASRDYADAYSQAVDRFKQFGAIRNTDDPWKEEIPRLNQQQEAFY